VPAFQHASCAFQNVFVSMMAVTKPTLVRLFSSFVR